MSLEAIDVITKAEEKARQIRADAAAEAKRAVRDAEEAGKAAIASAQKKADEELRQLTRKADEKAKANASELAVNTNNKKAAMQARADKRMDQAAMLIVERIVNG